MNNTDTIQIRELTSEQEWTEAHKVFVTLRPRLPLKDLLDRRESLLSRGYRLLGLYDRATLIGIAGIQILPHVLRGQDLRVHDFATHAEHLSRGYGRCLLNHMRTIAKNEGCSRIMLHSRMENTRAHSFYLGQGFDRLGFEFGLELAGEDSIE